MADPELSPMQAAFVREYLVDLNATKAAIRAGYSAHTAQEQSSRLLSKVIIINAVQKAQQKRTARVEVTADRVLMELSRLAFGDARAIFTANNELKSPADWPDELAAAISGVEVVTVSKGEGAVEYVSKVKFWDKGRALELLARHLGMLNDKLSLGTQDGKPLVQIYLPSNGRQNNP
jgi:phage terminase small subunit